MTSKELSRAVEKEHPPWTQPSCPEHRYDNRLWFISRSEMLGTLEDFELAALLESAKVRYLGELQGDHTARKVADQYLERLRSSSGR